MLKPTCDDVLTGAPLLAFTFGLGGIVVFPLHAGAAGSLPNKVGPDCSRTPWPSTAIAQSQAETVVP